MSQTAINRISNLKTKEFNSIHTSEILSATNSTKESPGVRTDFVTSPSDQHFTMNTEDTEEVFIIPKISSKEIFLVHCRRYKAIRGYKSKTHK